jgi:DNA-binding transcriptional ArsR family regulator
MTTRPGADVELVPAEDVPVSMPELPATLVVNTAQQFKAIGDPTRMRILDIIKHEPVTAKRIGERLHIPPGTIGHHLQVLEAAGLAQVVARRLVHGIVAKYYTRTARLFLLDFPPEVAARTDKELAFLSEAREQLAESLLAGGGEDVDVCKTAFPHARLSRERAEDFGRRLSELIYEFATATADPDGQVYRLCTAFFLAPPYLQSSSTSTARTEED